MLYCLALGQFKLGELIDARRRATELVAANPKDPKAQALKRDIEDALERDGAVGIVSCIPKVCQNIDFEPLWKTELPLPNGR